METEENLNLTQTHCVFFIYYTFACYNNGKVQNAEVQKIISYMKKWEPNEAIGKKIIKETVLWASKIIKSPEEAISTMFSMADYLNTESSFNVSKKELFLLDIRNISRMDNDFSEKEKKWHDLLAHHLNMYLRVSSCSTEDLKSDIKKVKRTKIGFRRPA